MLTYFVKDNLTERSYSTIRKHCEKYKVIYFVFATKSSSKVLKDRHNIKQIVPKTIYSSHQFTLMKGALKSKESSTNTLKLSALNRIPTTLNHRYWRLLCLLWYVWVTAHEQGVCGKRRTVFRVRWAGLKKVKEERRRRSKMTWKQNRHQGPRSSPYASHTESHRREHETHVCVTLHAHFNLLFFL